MKKILKHSGLSIVLVIIFIVCLLGQVFTGFHEHNSELLEEGTASLNLSEYLHSGHFIETTFENWESEFLQMGMFVVLSAFLYQKGSSESNDPDQPHQSEPFPGEATVTAWPMRRGRVMRFLYSYSLSLVFFLLFLMSFVLHWYGSCKDYNNEAALKGEEGSSMLSYLGNNRLWFESFQNWQSEFLAVFCVVVFSIFLRHKGSSQSKKITDPDSKTGE